MQQKTHQEIQEGIDLTGQSDTKSNKIIKIIVTVLLILLLLTGYLGLMKHM